MSKTLRICFKATGEHFDIPYGLQTTIYDLIKYVCTHGTVLLNTNPDNYYLAIDNSDMLDENRTVEETGLNQSGRFHSLDMCIKTRILMKRILESRTTFWEIPVTGISQKSQQTTAIKEPINTDKVVSTVDDINSEVHILVCGGPKVGKSTLINALCGCPVAKVSTTGLDQCTQKAKYYQLDNIYFWDTPGIQNWSDLGINSYINSSTRHQTPLCMFYCASPGSFAKLKELDILLEECICRRNIFCVLVVTNMFSNIQRHVILDEFKTLLSKYVNDNQQIREEHGVWYYGQVGLCTMVNSQEYVNEDNNRRQPQQGINELVLAMTKSLSATHQLGDWLRTIEQNQQFWLDKQEELYKLTETSHEICLSDLI